ncbi:MAG: 50S ribosomal protein L35 [Anaerosomatales bacterium]|nr:50S ribosomal protein L35 [Anaerosomatales bacterium]
MPKMKTHKGTAKRFRATGGGKIRRGNAYSSHILEKKSPKRKRAFRQPSLVSAADAKVIKKNLGIG